MENHPRLTGQNPLADDLAGGADPRTIIPDDAIIVRGGQHYQHQVGNIISAQMGATITDAASGLPHQKIRKATRW